MGEAIDILRDLREMKQQKRASNRERSAEYLKQCGIEFESKNNGAHLLVNAGTNGIIDFWPGTGLWIARYNGKKGRGVRGLAKLIKESRDG